MDFVKMWLILRALDEEEDWMVEKVENSTAYYGMNLFPYVNKHDFSTALSNLYLAQFAMPKFIRRWWWNKSPIDRGGKVSKKRYLRKIYLLLGEAERYLKNPSKERNPDMSDDDIAGTIRLCSVKDDASVFITSYIGGLNKLLSTFPAAWSFLAVALSPQWIPWIADRICYMSLSLQKFCGI